MDRDEPVPSFMRKSIDGNQPARKFNTKKHSRAGSMIDIIQTGKKNG